MIIASCSNNNQPVASITMNVDIVKEGSHKAFTVYKGYKIYKDRLSYKKALKEYNKLTEVK